MIAHLKGEIIKKTDKGIILSTGAVGYFVYLSKVILPQIEGKVELFIHHRIKEDASDLFGFQKYENLEFFMKLLSINGIGPKVALEILSVPSQQIKTAIADNDVTTICKIPGIGKKTAQRIILELKDKLVDLDRSHQAVNEEAIDALSKLGYQRREINEKLKDLPNEIKSTEEIITHFLKIQ